MPEYTPRRPSDEEKTTYRLSQRHNNLEALYKIYQLCLRGECLAEDFGSTLEVMRMDARQWRIELVRSRLDYIDRLQGGQTTHELLDMIEEYMREFAIDPIEVDCTNAEFENLRARAKPVSSPLTALHARAERQHQNGTLSLPRR